jgi:peptidoglycan-associated lipoprotein
MNHTKSKIRFIETFAIATFPIALAVGCSATGEKTASVGMQEDMVIQQQADISTRDLNTITYIETEKTLATTPVAYSEQEADSGNKTESENTQSEIVSMETVETIDSTPKNDAAEEAPEIKQVNLQVPESVKLEKPKINIFHFAFNKFDVDEQDYTLLKEHAEYLKENPVVVVNVNGYSDNRGSAKNNFEVSKKRAQQVANILMTYGVPESQIKVNSYGESFPLNDEKNWDENRRVELKYIQDTEAYGLIVSAF